MGWHRRFCSFSLRNKKPIQGWLSRSGFSTNNISHSLNHCFSSRNKKPIQGWLSRSGFSTNNISHHCFSSRNKKPIQGWLSRSSFSFSTNNISYCLKNPRPMFSKSIVVSQSPTLWKSAQFQSIHPFLNGAGGAKRFYCVDRYQLAFSHFRRLCIEFSKIVVAVISAYCLVLLYLKLEFSKTVPYTKRSRALIVTWHGERVTGKISFERLEADKLLPLDHPDSIRIRGIAHNIIQALHRDLKKHEIKKCDSWHLLEGLEFFVFDGPIDPCRSFGKKIVVSRGLLDHFTSDAEIATIIGHEVGHVVGRHNAERVTKLIFWSFPYLVDDSYLLDTFLFFEKLPFSRRLELEADYIGMLLMASAGYDPWVAPQVYEKLEEINNHNNNDNDSTILGRLIYRYPHAKTRVQSLTRAKVMKEALCRYREARGIPSESNEAE